MVMKWWGWAQAQALGCLKFRQTLLFVNQHPPVPPATVVVTPPPSGSKVLVVTTTIIGTMSGVAAASSSLGTYVLQEEAVKAEDKYKKRITALEEGNKNLEAENNALKKSLLKAEQRAANAESELKLWWFQRGKV